MRGPKLNWCNDHDLLSRSGLSQEQLLIMLNSIWEGSQKPSHELVLLGINTNYPYIWQTNILDSKTLLGAKINFLKKSVLPVKMAKCKKMQYLLVKLQLINLISGWESNSCKISLLFDRSIFQREWHWKKPGSIFNFNHHCSWMVTTQIIFMGIEYLQVEVILLRIIHRNGNLDHTSTYNRFMKLTSLGLRGKPNSQWWLWKWSMKVFIKYWMQIESSQCTHSWRVPKCTNCPSFLFIRS